MPDRIAWEDCKYWKSSKGLEQYLLAEDDIVLAMDRPWISEGFKVAKLTSKDVPSLLIQRTARIRSTKMNSDFVLSLLAAPAFAKQCKVTATTVPHISMGDIKDYEIIIPPLPLQEQFAAFVRQSDKSKFVAHQLASNLNFSSCLETRNAIRNSFK